MYSELAHEVISHSFGILSNRSLDYYLCMCEPGWVGLSQHVFIAAAATAISEHGRLSLVFPSVLR